jgi:hypothetical protein
VPQANGNHLRKVHNHFQSHARIALDQVEKVRTKKTDYFAWLNRQGRSGSWGIIEKGLFPEKIAYAQGGQELAAPILPFLHDLHLSGEDDVHPDSSLPLPNDGFARNHASSMQNSLEFPEFPPIQVPKKRDSRQDFEKGISLFIPATEKIAPEGVQSHVFPAFPQKGKTTLFLAKEPFIRAIY